MLAVQQLLTTKLKYLLQDDNRYNSSRGAHLNLKRAEKARILVNKIPGISSNYNMISLYFSCEEVCALQNLFYVN
jgi:hypothetical protein